MKTGIILILSGLLMLNLFCGGETQSEKEKRLDKDAKIILPIIDETRKNLIPPNVSASCRSGYTSFAANALVISQCARCHKEESGLLVFEDTDKSYNSVILYIEPGDLYYSKLYLAVTGKGKMVPFTLPEINTKIVNWITICKP